MSKVVSRPDPVLLLLRTGIRLFLQGTTTSQLPYVSAQRLKFILYSATDADSVFLKEQPRVKTHGGGGGGTGGTDQEIMLWRRPGA